MKTFLSATAALIALGLAIPATARTAPPPPAPEKISDHQRICVVDQITGSRLAKKTCQTRAEWAKQGLDPLAK